ncbi:30S ribosomal protein S9 [Candidatus Sumerlaeota bacterium]|nr:30S ribosomal protein S9 [Candidatus Sumerlaeales bacterium]NLD61450.1 30S ribosomal protein S9 [Candidatus Sumerlaeota bacterium]
MAIEQYTATGRRKTSTARVYLRNGKGKIVVNGKPFPGHFGPRESVDMMVKQPLKETHNLTKYDIIINVNGGGIMGQASAIRHGISRALIKVNPAFRPTLKSFGFLTRDPRMKERKKYGQKGARKRFQFSKR